MLRRIFRASLSIPFISWVALLSPASGLSIPLTQEGTAAASLMTEEAFLRFGQQLDLDELIRSLRPPSVEEIITRLGPIPTREKVLEEIRNPQADLRRPELSAETSARVLEYERRGAELSRAAALSEDAATRRTILDEAITLAEEAIRARIEAGQPSDAFERGDAAYFVETLKHLRDDLSPEEHRQLAAAVDHEEIAEQFEHQQRYDEVLAIRCAQVEIRRRLLPPDHPATAAALRQLARTLHMRGDVQRAEPLYLAALAMRVRLYPVGHPDTAWSMDDVASVVKDRMALEPAEALLRASWGMCRRLHGGADHPDVARSLNNFAFLLNARGALQQSEPCLRAALDMRRRLYPGDHSEVALTLNALGNVLFASGSFEESQQLLREELDMQRRLNPQGHPQLAQSLHNLAYVLYRQGETDEGVKLCREALAVCSRYFEGDDPGKAYILSSLAAMLKERGELADAESHASQAVDMRRRLYAEDHADTARSVNQLALLLQARGDLARAEPYFRDSLAMYRRLFPTDHPDVATSLSNLAIVLLARGAADQAEPLFEDALDMSRRLYPADHDNLAGILSNLAAVHAERDELESAESLLREALTMRRRLFAGDHPQTARNLMALGNVLGRRGFAVEAEALLREARASMQRLFPGDHPDLASCLHGLACNLERNGNADEAEQAFRDALAMRRRLFSGDHPAAAETLYTLARLLEARGATAEVEALLKEAFDMSERLRTGIIGGEQERAGFSTKLDLIGRANAYAGALIRQGLGADALSVLERGRARAALDLLERSGRDLTAESVMNGDASVAARRLDARRREDSARGDVFEAEERLIALSRERDQFRSREGAESENGKARLDEYQRRLAGLETDVRAKRVALTQAGAAVLNELRGLFPAGEALPAAEILRRLQSDEAIISFSWSRDRVLVCVAAQGKVDSAAPAGDAAQAARLSELAGKVRASLTEPRGSMGEGDTASAKDLLKSLLPPALRAPLVEARRLVVLPDGPLAEIPLEALLFLEGDASLSDKAVVYAPSATIYFQMVARAGALASRVPPRSSDSLLVLGDPRFDRRRAEPEVSHHGALIASLVPGGNAAKAGLKRGDVVLQYADRVLDEMTPLPGAIAAVSEAAQRGDRPADMKVGVTVWREGEQLKIELPPGKLGVRLQPGDPARGLGEMRFLDRGADEAQARADALDQARLYGGSLPSLPDTRLEALAIAELFRRHAARTVLSDGVSPSTAPRVRVLLDGDATAAKLAQDARGIGCLHVATHGLMGSSTRPLASSLALTPPETLSPGDIGFLTLEDLILKWGGLLSDCRLVVLSACNSQRGVRRGDSTLSLPLGFFFSGAPTVVASLWNVPDTSTALLMTRFYENLLGEHDDDRLGGGRRYRFGQPMSKLEALDEARAWLRALTRDEADRTLKRLEQMGASVPSTTGAAAGDGAIERGVTGRSVAPGAGSDKPYVHPYYWAAFVLIGAGE